MRIETIFDQGTAKYIEDMLVLKIVEGFGGSSLIAGVVDGVSELYIPARGPKLFNGKTGGQVICAIIEHSFSSTQTEDSLETILSRANEEIKLRAMKQGIPMDRSDLLPGAAFALAKINHQTIEVLQGADCFAVWLKNNGEIGATRNQIFLHDLDWRQIMADLLKKYQGNRNKAWREIIPALSRARLEHVNKRENGYALLNGQLTLSECWQKITLPHNDIKLLLLFTDGLIPFQESKDEQVLGTKIINLFQLGGLKMILEETREIEEAEKETTHIDHAEASGTAIEL